LKILFDHSLPFQFAHGGFQTQIEQTKLALESLGVEVEWLRWWDDQQEGTIVHYFGRPAHDYIALAHQRGLKVVIGELLTGLGSRAPSRIRVQRLITTKLRRFPLLERMGWRAYELADAAIALTPWEAQLMREVFSAPLEKLHVIPNGVEEVFLNSAPQTRGEWLICTATITERKRVLELAQAAVAGRVPVWVVGKPYGESDPYYRAFLELARAQPEFIRYEGPVTDRATMAGIYRQARGFVLLSTMESLSLSALEAAACECPLLLSDLPWARTTFGAEAQYCPPNASAAATGEILRQFHTAAPTLPHARRPLTWREVAAQLRGLYERL
jgi:glycosyltransferase involved in cell wall biosynthesis